MTADSAEFGRPVNLEPVPAYLRDVRKTSPFLKNGTVEDYSWHGDDGTENW